MVRGPLLYSGRYVRVAECQGSRKRANGWAVGSRQQAAGSNQEFRTDQLTAVRVNYDERSQSESVWVRGPMITTRKPRERSQCEFVWVGRADGHNARTANEAKVNLYELRWPMISTRILRQTKPK